MNEHAYLRKHTLSAEFLSLDLDQTATDMRALTGTADRHAVTLVHEDGVSIIVASLHAGAALSEHSAPGPVTVQVLDGRVEVAIGEVRQELEAGRLVAIAGSVPHAVRALEDSTLLLTVVDRGEPHDVSLA